MVGGTLGKIKQHGEKLNSTGEKYRFIRNRRRLRLEAGLCCEKLVTGQFYWA